MAEKYIPLSAALSVAAAWCPDDDGSVGKTGDLREMLDELEAIEPADVRPVVLCRDCIMRAVCRTSNIWAVPPRDDWFCADGRRNGADMRPEPPEREVGA